MCVICYIKSCPHYGKTSCNPGLNCERKWDSTKFTVTGTTR